MIRTVGLRITVSVKVTKSSSDVLPITQKQESIPITQSRENGQTNGLRRTLCHFLKLQRVPETPPLIVSDSRCKWSYRFVVSDYLDSGEGNDLGTFW